MGQTDMNENEKHEMLRQEYFHLQTTLESFDGKSLTIKAWSVTLGVAVIGSGAFVGGSILIYIAASVGSLLFWIIDANWKLFQYCYYQRIYEIEDYFSGKKDTIEAPSVATSWSRSWGKYRGRKQCEIFFWSHVFLPHGAMFVLFVALAVLAATGVIGPTTPSTPTT